MFSRSSQYGVKASIYIASVSKDCKRVSIKDIAKEIDSPEAFTAKIVQNLVHHGFIDSAKGPSGGYCIKPELLDRLTLGDIIQAIDGPELTQACALGLRDCNNDRPCPVHHKYKDIRNALNDMLFNTRISQLVDGLVDASSVLKQ